MYIIVLCMHTIVLCFVLLWLYHPFSGDPYHTSHHILDDWSTVTWAIAIAHCHLSIALNDMGKTPKCSKTRTVHIHYNSDVIMTTMASQITSLTVVYSIVYSDTDLRKHQSSALLAFVRGIHRWPVNYPHKGPVTRKMFPFDDIIMYLGVLCTSYDIHDDCNIYPAQRLSEIFRWFMEVAGCKTEMFLLKT